LLFGYPRITLVVQSHSNWGVKVCDSRPKSLTLRRVQMENAFLAIWDYNTAIGQRGQVITLFKVTETNANRAIQPFRVAPPGTAPLLAD